ncbi:protein phosphatase 2C domain-containing protein [Streptomyces sp. MNU103]|nr:protein phosphatase 2C domain-containing protein [Streptomyces sp. MNU103]
MRVCFDSLGGGSNPNEDWVAGSSQLALVLDGLSTAGLPTGCRHGVPWFVAHLGGHLMATLADPSVALSDGLAAALERVAALHSECDLGNPGTPSATVAVLRQSDQVLDYLVLADSPVVFEGTEGGHTVVTDLRVDDVLPDLRAEVEQHETHTQGHREALQRLVRAQRVIRNTSDGYWVAGANPEAAQHGLTGSVMLRDVRSAAVMSDGVSRLVSEYKVATWDDIFVTLRADGPRGLIQTVRETEATDPTGRRWPRYKSGDDATVAYCRW